MNRVFCLYSAGACPELGGVPFSTRTRYNGPYNPGSQITYSCRYGGGTGTVTCGQPPGWTKLPTCPKHCPQPVGVPSYVKTRFKGPHKPGSKLNYDGAHGGTATITCQNNGSWTLIVAGTGALLQFGLFCVKTGGSGRYSTHQIRHLFPRVLCSGVGIVGFSWV